MNITSKMVPNSVVEALGDGDEEKRLIWKQEGYGHNALFDDFACPGEVGFDQGWLACKNKVATLSQQPDHIPDAGRKVDHGQAEGLLREAREFVAYAGDIALDERNIADAQELLTRIDSHIKEQTDEQG